MSRGGVEDIRLEAKAKNTKKSGANTKDSPSENRPSRGQGQECSRPRPRKIDTSASVVQKKRLSKFFFRQSQKKTKKKGLQNFFQVFSSKKRLSKNFFMRYAKVQQFKKKCCPRAEDRAIYEDLRHLGQGQGLDLWCQGQGLQNVSSRTPPLIMRASPVCCPCPKMQFLEFRIYAYKSK